MKCLKPYDSQTTADLPPRTADPDYEVRHDGNLIVAGHPGAWYAAIDPTADIPAAIRASVLNVRVSGLGVAP